MQFLALERLHQLYDGYKKVFRIDGREWLLVQDEGQVSVFESRCPHMGASLNGASVEAGALRCPRHGMTFSLRDGRCLTTGCENSLQFLRVAYEGNQIGIYLS